MNEKLKILDIIRNSEQFLQQKGVDSPRLIAELIISDFLHLSRLELYTNFEKPLTNNEIYKLRDLITRAGKHEPVQYIIGETDFLDIKIKCDKRALIPRPETEELTSIIDYQLHGDENILDIGTGSGCISVYLANKNPNVIINAIDISKDALNLAKENAEKYNLNNIKFFEADILKRSPQNKYDVVVSNPPYISSNEISSLDINVKKFEPMEALDGGKNGVTFFEHIASILKNILSENGIFFLEFGYGQKELLEKVFIDYQIEIKKDMQKQDRFIIGRVAY